MFRLGLQLPSAATTLGAGDPFVPTNLDFIDWEDRLISAGSGLGNNKIRQAAHTYFEGLGEFDIFPRLLSHHLFAGVINLAGCFVPLLPNMPTPQNDGFVEGDYLGRRRLKGSIERELNLFIDGLPNTNSNINSSGSVYVYTPGTIGIFLTTPGGALDRRVQVAANGIRIYSQDMPVDSTKTGFIGGTRFDNTQSWRRADGITTPFANAPNASSGDTSIRVFARHDNVSGHTDAGLSALTFGQSLTVSQLEKLDELQSAYIAAVEAAA